MGLLFYNLYTVLSKDFAEVPRRLQDGTMMNLNNSKPGDDIERLLQKGFYFKDQRDIRLISSVVRSRQTMHQDEVDNIGELNKKKYEVSADEAFARGGESFKNRVKTDRALIGFSASDSTMFEQERKAPVNVPTAINLGMGTQTIKGVINNTSQQPVANVLVRMQLVLPEDSIYSDNVEEVDRLIVENKNGVRKVFAIDSLNHRQLQSLTAYARTGSNGSFSFTGLPAQRSYQVLPLQPGFEFGRSQGVQSLNEEVSFQFKQSPHMLKLFSTRDFSNLKKDRALIVRTPQQVTKWYVVIVASFFLAFLVLHLLLSFKFQNADQLLLPVLMLLTGVSLLTLLSLQDPLRDRFLAKSTLTYFGAGIGGMLVLMLFNMRYFTTDSLLYRLFVFKANKRAANGWPWALVAIGLLVLTILFGTGPEGSGVKVNLFGFQPSEIVKFLVLIFLAGYFSTNEKFISEYSSWKRRTRFFAFALIAIVATILLFLILGDLGPAMVCCFTFIILFSFSRGDFLQMTGAVVLYVLAVWLFRNPWIGTAVTIAGLLLYMLIKKQQLSESAVMALVVIAGFLLLDQVPYIGKLISGTH